MATDSSFLANKFVEVAAEKVVSMLGVENFVDAEAGPMHAEDRKTLALSVSEDAVGNPKNGEKESVDMNEDMDFADAETGSQSDVCSVSIQELNNSVDFEDNKSEGKPAEEIIADEKAVIENHHFGLSRLSTNIEEKGFHSEEEIIFEADSGNKEDTHGNVLELKDDTEGSTQLDESEKHHDDVHSERVVSEEDIDQDSCSKTCLSNNESSHVVNEVQDVVSKTFPSEVFESYELTEVVAEGEEKVAPGNVNTLSEENRTSLSSIDTTSISQYVRNEDIVDEEVVFSACPEEEYAMDEEAAAGSQSAFDKVCEGVADDAVVVPASADGLISLSAFDDTGKDDVIGEGTKDDVDEDAAPTSLEHLSSPVVIDKIGKENAKNDGEFAPDTSEEVVAVLKDSLLSETDDFGSDAVEVHNIGVIHGDIAARNAADGRHLLDSSGIANETLGHEIAYQVVQSENVTMSEGLIHGDTQEEEAPCEKSKVAAVESQFEEGGDRNKTTDNIEKHILTDADESAVEKVSSNSPITNSSSLVASTDKEDDSDAKHRESTKENVNASDSLAEVSALEASSLAASKPSLPSRPAGLGRSTPLEHGPRAVQRDTGTSASQSSTPSVDEQLNEDPDGNEDSKMKLQMIRVKFLRLANRLGQSANNVVVAQVLYRLGLAEQLRGARGSSRSNAFSLERASVIAEEQEAVGHEDLDFGCTIMVLGKTGVGKSATINSLFDKVKTETDAYMPATKTVQEISGTVHGIRLKVIDTPGLLMSFADQRHNEKIMASVKRYIKKSPPDIVLYFDRLDMQTRDYGDLPLLRTITDTFGAAIWFNAIVVLTHASSAPPDGANGGPLSYEMFVAQRSHVVQQSIRQAAGDMRLMNPVSLVENHAACRTNRTGQRVLPNGQVWKPQLLLLCFASKILAEANSLLKLQDSSPGKPFSIRPRVPPLPFLLSSLLQSRAPPKLPDEQMDDDDDGDGEGSEDSDEDADSEGDDDYDSLPPFRRLTNDELRLLTKEQKKAYFDELEYREKLFMKKQWKDEKVRRREMKRKLAALPKGMPQIKEDVIEEESGAASVPVPMPDMALPPSFDSDNPTYRYRYLEAANQWLVRPVLETHGWDHDSGYDGLNVEKAFVIKKRIPASLSGQLTKDKKEATVQMECAASLKMGEGKSTMAGLDVQTVGKDLACTLRSETRFNNFKKNKTICGLSVTLLGGTIASGMKIEDRLMLGKRLKIVVNGGAVTGRGNVAYGGSAEVSLHDKDYPIGRSFSTLGLSVMNWHGDLAIGGNLQVQFQVGKTMMIGRANLNNRGAGQLSIRASSSEQLQMALIGLIPLFRALMDGKIFKSSQ